jgi:hypothetical protein
VFTFVRRRSAARQRLRLARAVRDYAHAERDLYHRAGVLEFASVASRAALYERIVDRLEQTDHALADEALRRLEGLIAESPPVRDYGPRAAERNARIASILDSLEGGR